jgi:hypothetical protein
MNSLPIIEGLTYTYADVKNLYDQVVSDMNDFFSSYQTYTQCSSSSTTTQCSNTDVQNKLEKVNASLAQFNDAVAQNNDNNRTRDTVQLEQKLKEIRAKVHEKTKLITDVRNSVGEDYILKRNSYYYQNMVISIFLACAIYYIFFKLDSRKI